MAILPHANNFQFNDQIIIDILSSTSCLYCSKNHQLENYSIARLNYAESYEKGKDIGLDNHLRQIAPPQFKNTMHATNVFMEKNGHILRHCRISSPISGRLVNGAQLLNSNNIEDVINPAIQKKDSNKKVRDKQSVRNYSYIGLAEDELKKIVGEIKPKFNHY